MEISNNTKPMTQSEFNDKTIQVLDNLSELAESMQKSQENLWLIIQVLTEKIKTLEDEINNKYGNL